MLKYANPDDQILNVLNFFDMRRKYLRWEIEEIRQKKEGFICSTSVEFAYLYSGIWWNLHANWKQSLEYSSFDQTKSVAMKNAEIWHL